MSESGKSERRRKNERVDLFEIGPQGGPKPRDEKRKEARHRKIKYKKVLVPARRLVICNSDQKYAFKL